MKANPPNARFWTFYRTGWVKITLRPGQSLTASFSTTDDEGYSYESETWEHSGHEIQCRWADGGRDCDGPIRRAGSAHCALANLAAKPAYTEPGSDRERRGEHLFQGRHIHRPEWVQGRSETFDAFAEAAGY